MAIGAKQLWLSDELESSTDPLESWCVCRRCFDGCAAFRDECADYLAGIGKGSGALTRKITFSENGVEGVLLQIRDADASFATEEVSLECGPDVTVAIRLVPLGDKLEVSMGRGKWPDDIPQSKLGWQDLKPLVTEGSGQGWRHRYAVSGLRDAAEAWLLHRSGVMPSIVNMFGEREVL